MLICRQIRLLPAVRRLCLSTSNSGVVDDAPMPFPEYDKVNYDVCHDSFSHVEPYLPLQLVPIPKHISKTPSGWVPQVRTPDELPYFVKRSSKHNVPVYEMFRHYRIVPQKFGSKKVPLTVVRLIEGDIWKFHQDLKEHLAASVDDPILTQVKEIGNKIYIHGHHRDVIVQFLLERGF